MMRPLYAVALMTVASGAACTRVVDLDLVESRRQLVVEARLESGTFVQQIRLSTTDEFSRAGPPPAATGAIVVVADEAGGSYPFTEQPARPGSYTAAGIPLAVGRRYTLTIDYQGARYRAEQVMVDVAPIDSLYFKFEKAGIAQGDSGFRAVIDYSDPPGQHNFYLWEMYVDGVRGIATDPGARFRVISDDEFYDGGVVIGYQPYDELVVEPGQLVEVRQLGISEEAFRYYFVLFEQTTSGGGPFSTPPASVRGNVANLTDPGHRALGFFLASSVASRFRTVPPR